MHIVIVGGGFAGVNLAKDLGSNAAFNVTLVDKNNYNFFPPLIYQVATAFLEPSSISYPFRKLFANHSNVQFRLGELQKVFPAEKQIVLNNGSLGYDVLILATGAETNYFGMENVRKNATPMKTLDDAIEMRNKFLLQMEKAAICTSDEERRKLLTIVVAGGGPTGVEISGMFAEMRKGILRKEYPELAGKGGEIYLVDGSPALLSPMSVQSQKHTYDSLRRLGVKMKLDVHVKDFVDDVVYIDNGDTIVTKNLIWAAGVSARIIDGIPAESYGRGRRMLVDAHNKVQGVDHIYAIGDTSIMLSVDDKFPGGHPQVAQVAIQQGKLLAKNLKRIFNKQEPRPFAYHDKGSMAIIGKNKAVVDLPKPKLHFSGLLAWLVWLFIHLLSLITYRNRVRTFWNWMIAYFTKDQSLRMIIKPGDTDKRQQS